MADNPFDQFDAPKANPFDQFDKPVATTTKTAPATAMPAALTYDTTDPNSSWGSWALSKLHNAAVGGNLWNKVFQDSATFGGADVLQGKIAGSPSTDELRAQTEEAKKQIGPVGSATAELSGYAMVPGGLKVGEGLAGLAGGGKLARIGGSALENAGASGLGTLGHGGSWTDAGKNALVGLGVGTLTGALPGGAGTRPTTPLTSELKTNAQNAFTPLENTWINSRGVGQNFDRVTSGLPTRADLSSSLNSKIDEISNEIGDSTGVMSVDTIARYQRALMKAARGDVDRKVAGDYGRAFDTSLGPHAPAVADANALANKYKTSRDIDKWLTDPGKAPSAVAGKLNKSPQYYQSEPGLFDALKQVGDKAKEPPLWKKARDYAADAAIKSAIGAGGAYALGQNPLAGAATGFATKVALPHVAAGVAAGPVRQGLLAAQHLNATGVPVNPDVFVNPWLQGIGMLARKGGYAAGASDDLNLGK
jgi:hypothetical protein